MIAIFILLVLFQFKHFMADYPLQVPWMLGKFKDKGWAGPLAAHCAVHALVTVGIGMACAWVPWIVILQMALFDFFMHFAMDRVKASPRLLGRFKPLNGYQYSAMQAVVNGDPIGAPFPVEEAKARLKSNQWFWYSLGIDQGFHHLTHYAIIAVYYLCMTH